MTLDILENNFGSYLESYRELSDIAPFLLTYIRLLFLFKSELSMELLLTISERQKQLRGGQIKSEGFEKVISAARNEMRGDLSINSSLTRNAMLNRLLFCALLDSEENEFLYLTEPMFDFVRIMEVSLDQLKPILEAEFVGFKAC